METETKSTVPETQSSSACVAGPSRPPQQQQQRGKSSPARASGNNSGGQHKQKRRLPRLPTGNEQLKSAQNLPDLFRSNFLLGGFGMAGGGVGAGLGVGDGNNPLISHSDLTEVWNVFYYIFLLFY